MSNTKRLAGEMSSFEAESSKIIPPSSLYAVKISFDQILSIEDIKKIATDELYSDPRPLSVYYNENTMILFFSYVVENYYLPGGSAELFYHQLGGNHHHIVSKYTTNFARNPLLITSKITVSIIEFQMQTQVIAYLGWTIFQTSQDMLVKLSNGKITDELLQFRTQSELKDLLLGYTGVKWDDIKPQPKYGCIIKLKRKKNKSFIIEMSESFDARETKKYTNYFVFS